jgi:hypothetical protein
VRIPPHARETLKVIFMLHVVAGAHVKSDEMGDSMEASFTEYVNQPPGGSVSVCCVVSVQRNAGRLTENARLQS